MYEFPEEVTFHPWVGSHYKDSDNHFGFRLLVLGESHYDVLNEADQDPDWIAKRNSSGEHVFTQYVVRRWAQENNHRFFTVTANVLLGRKHAVRDEANSEIWEHVAFYNYVQSYVPWCQDDNLKRPTTEQWTESKAPFETVLQSLKPDAVLMLGSELSWWVKELHKHTNFKETYQSYRHEHLNFLGIYHPRGGLSYDKANPAFEELVRLTQSR